jgi:PAS domain S-box-containing protein
MMVNDQTLTELIQRKDKLLSYDLLRLISENAQDMITITTPEGKVEYISPSVKTLLGYEQDEILGTLSHETFYYED